MDFINLKGIVTREVDTGEGDKYIDLFTDKLGKVTIYVKCAKGRKALLSGTQVLNYCEYILYKKMDKYYISSCELIESFYGIRCEVVYLTYAAHFLDIINSVILENQSQVTLLKLLLNTLYILSKGKKNPKIINAVFELRLLKILGYEPYVKGCIVCGSDCDIMYFDFFESGFMCKDCKKNRSFKLARDIKDAIRFIMNASIKDIFKFNIDEDSLNKLCKLSKIYLKEKLDKEYNKLDFLLYIN